MRLTALLTLAGLTGALIYSYWPERRPPTAIALEAENSKPEIAELLREVDRVICELTERFPDNPEALDVMARAHYRLGKTEAAEAYWQQCLELNNNFCPAIHSIGLTGLEVGDHKKAIKYFRRALELEPGSPTFSVELAQALLADGQTTEAIRVLQKDLRLHPKAPATLAMLGQAYLQDRQYANAKKYCERAIVVAPTYSNAYNGLVAACANLGEEEQAKQYAETLKEIKAEEADMHRERLKDHDDAVKTEGMLGEIYTAAANVYLAQNEPAMAEKCLLKSIQHTPEFVAPHEILVWLYQQQGRKREAVEMLQTLLSVAPDDVASQLGCAELCAELGRFNEAEKAYQAAIDLAPEQAGGYAALAWLYIDQVQKLPEAKRLATKVVEMEPLAKHYYLLGVACQINRDQAGARKAIARATELEPQNPEYRKVLQIIGKPEDD
jgi:tetratricopeptide (TPR) repeat protein